MSIMDRLRSLPFHQWILIGVGILSVYIAYLIFKQHAAGSSSSATAAGGVPVGGVGQPDWSSISTGQSSQGNDILATLQGLPGAIAAIIASGNGSVPTPSTPGGGAVTTTNPGNDAQNHTTYTVLQGDTLSGIAGHVGSTWQTLYQLNKSTIDSTAQSHGASPGPWTGTYADWIYPGEQIQLN